MIINSFTKTLYPSNLGEAGMHDRYITVPKRQVNPVDFFGNPPSTISILDQDTQTIHEFPYKLESNGEYRLTQFGDYFDSKNAQISDEVRVDKIEIEGVISFNISFISNNIEEPELHFDEVMADEDEEGFNEGRQITVKVNKYERNSQARQACINHYGTKCQACDFDFEDAFGAVGEGFIHVHHKVPIADIGEGYTVNPINDLIPVCPNCHAMIHKRKPPYTLEEIKEMLN